MHVRCASAVVMRSVWISTNLMYSPSSMVCAIARRYSSCSTGVSMSHDLRRRGPHAGFTIACSFVAVELLATPVVLLAASAARKTPQASPTAHNSRIAENRFILPGLAAIAPNREATWSGGKSGLRSETSLGTPATAAKRMACHPSPSGGATPAQRAGL